MITHTGRIHRNLFPSLLWQMPSHKIFLTFDDGPHPDATLTALEVLRRHDVHATFFLTGEHIPGHEDIVRRIAGEGHSIGIHAYTHTRSLAMSKERTKEEILRTRQMLSELTRQKIRLFRPPFGFFSWNTIAAARELDFVLVMWSCLTGDFRARSNDRIVATATSGLRNGSILVFHDNDLTEKKIGTLLDQTIIEIKNRGFEFGAIR